MSCNRSYESSFRRHQIAWNLLGWDGWWMTRMDGWRWNQGIFYCQVRPLEDEKSPFSLVKSSLLSFQCQVKSQLQSGKFSMKSFSLQKPWLLFSSFNEFYSQFLLSCLRFFWLGHLTRSLLPYWQKHKCTWLPGSSHRSGGSAGWFHPAPLGFNSQNVTTRYWPYVITWT